MKPYKEAMREARVAYLTELFSQTKSMRQAAKVSGMGRQQIYKLRDRWLPDAKPGQCTTSPPSSE